MKAPTYWRRRRGKVMGEGALVPSRMGGGSGARCTLPPTWFGWTIGQKTYVVHSIASRKPLVAMTLLIFIARRHHDARYWYGICLSVCLSVCLSHVSKQTYISTYFFHCLLQPSFLHMHVNDQLVHTETVTSLSKTEIVIDKSTDWCQQ